MIMRGLSLERCPVNNLYEAMIFVAWTILAAYLVLGLFPRCGTWLVCRADHFRHWRLRPHAGAGCSLQRQAAFSNALVSLHAALSLLSYGAFGLSGRRR